MCRNILNNLYCYFGRFIDFSKYQYLRGLKFFRINLFTFYLFSINLLLLLLQTIVSVSCNRERGELFKHQIHETLGISFTADKF